MTDETSSPNFHNTPDRFREALLLAESVTGFSARLIEKDYYCSVVLRDFGKLFAGGLVFKGGTSLSKVHAEFFRLSEDLDFSASISPTATRGERRRAADPFKAHFADLTTRYPCFRIDTDLKGHNDSRQYDARLSYQSVVTAEPDFLKVELAIREHVIVTPVTLPARTLVTDPYTNSPAVEPFEVSVLIRDEAYAEKIRAALTRREPAIRDFFDIGHAVTTGLVAPLDPSFLALVAAKLGVTQDPVDLSDAKAATLAAQVDAHLKPVLRAKDFESFALEAVLETLRSVAAKLNNG